MFHIAKIRIKSSTLSLQKSTLLCLTYILPTLLSRSSYDLMKNTHNASSPVENENQPKEGEKKKRGLQKITPMITSHDLY